MSTSPCKGRGRIPVVFLAGGRANGVVWNGLIAALGDDVFTCVYNRPGTTAEEVEKPPTERTTPKAVASGLATTLQRAGVGPPCRVGRALGRRHGRDGVRGRPPGARGGRGVVRSDDSRSGARGGVVPRRLTTAPRTIAEGGAVTGWPDVPLVILTADSKLVIKNKEATPAEERAWVAGHKRWAALSAEGVQREVPGTSHAVYLTAPTVARDTVLDVVDRAGCTSGRVGDHGPFQHPVRGLAVPGVPSDGLLQAEALRDHRRAHHVARREHRLALDRRRAAVGVSSTTVTSWPFGSTCSSHGASYDPRRDQLAVAVEDVALVERGLAVGRAAGTRRGRTRARSERPTTATRGRGRPRAVALPAAGCGARRR